MEFNKLWKHHPMLMDSVLLCPMDIRYTTSTMDPCPPIQYAPLEDWGEEFSSDDH